MWCRIDGLVRFVSLNIPYVGNSIATKKIHEAQTQNSLELWFKKQMFTALSLANSAPTDAGYHLTKNHLPIRHEIKIVKHNLLKYLKSPRQSKTWWKWNNFILPPLPTVNSVDFQKKKQRQKQLISQLTALLAWIIHEDSACRRNLARQVGQSSEKRGPLTYQKGSEEDGPRCDARFSSDVE